MQRWEAQHRQQAMAISFHGDEGEAKKAKRQMILSWSGFGTHSPVAHKNKIPFTEPCPHICCVLNKQIQHFQDKAYTFPLVFDI